MERRTNVQGSKYQKRYPYSGRSIKHYSNSLQILLVGEGDFSFSLALGNAFGSAENMVATSIDSREKVLWSYKSASETLSKLRRLGATILHGVDATTMEKHHIIRKRSFDRIVYNFPHAGFYGKETDKTVIKKHRHLLKIFFKNASTVLSTMGEIHVTHQKQYPYNKWKLVKQAEKIGLLLKESVSFSKGDYPGYINRRGAGYNAGDSFYLGECSTYKFILSPTILHLRKLMATEAILPDFSTVLSVENFRAVIMELKSERQARKAAEKAKTDLEASLNDLKMIADEDIKKRAELVRQKNDALHQKAQAWREKEIIGKQLDEALRSIKDEKNSIGKQLDEAFKSIKDEKEKNRRQLDEALKSNKEEIKRKELSLKEAILETEFEKQARKTDETAKADLENSYSPSKMLLEKEGNENDELKMQRDEAFYQKEEPCRGKTDTAKQLNEALVEDFKEAIVELEFEGKRWPPKRPRRVGGFLQSVEDACKGRNQ